MKLLVQNAAYMCCIIYNFRKSCVPQNKAFQCQFGGGLKLACYAYLHYTYANSEIALSGKILVLTRKKQCCFQYVPLISCYQLHTYSSFLFDFQIS